VDAVGGGAHLVGDIGCNCGVLELAQGNLSFKVLGHQFSTGAGGRAVCLAV
jgi:hypothetical protein